METKDLIALIDQAAADLKRAPSTICREATGNGHLYERLKDGRECLPSTARRLREHIEAARERAA